MLKEKFSCDFLFYRFHGWSLCIEQVSVVTTSSRLPWRCLCAVDSKTLATSPIKLFLTSSLPCRAMQPSRRHKYNIDRAMTNHTLAATRDVGLLWWQQSRSSNHGHLRPSSLLIIIITLFVFVDITIIIVVISFFFFWTHFIIIIMV